MIHSKVWREDIHAPLTTPFYQLYWKLTRPNNYFPSIPIFMPSFHQRFLAPPSPLLKKLQGPVEKAKAAVEVANIDLRTCMRYLEVLTSTTTFVVGVCLLNWMLRIFLWSSLWKHQNVIRACDLNFPIGLDIYKKAPSKWKKKSPGPLLMDQRVFVTRHRPKLERFQKRTTILKTAGRHTIKHEGWTRKNRQT